MNSTKIRHGNKNSKHFKFDIFSDLSIGTLQLDCSIGYVKLGPQMMPTQVLHGIITTRSDGLIQAMQGDQRASIRC